VSRIKSSLDRLPAFKRFIRVLGRSFILVGAAGFIVFLHAFYFGHNPVSAAGEAFGLNPMRGYQRSLWLIAAGIVLLVVSLDWSPVKAIFLLSFPI
jgi:hypothetical protein